MDGMEGFATEWNSKYRVPVTEVCLKAACSQGSIGTRARNLALLCLADSCADDGAFGAMRPQLQQLLELGIFSAARFNDGDADTWRNDPDEYLRVFFDDFGAFSDPRAAAVDLVERLVQAREDEVLQPLLAFCRQHLDAQKQNPDDKALCANKDWSFGVTFLVSAFSSCCLSLCVSSVVAEDCGCLPVCAVCGSVRRWVSLDSTDHVDCVVFHVHLPRVEFCQNGGVKCNTVAGDAPLQVIFTLASIKQDAS